jgi:hypothetical protein
MTLSKRTLLIIVLVVLLSGASLGRLVKPLVRVETKTVDHVVYQDRVVEKVIEVAVTAKQDDKQRVEVRTEDRKPDGSTHVEVRTEYVDRVVERTVQAQAEVRTEVKYVDRVVTQEKIVTPSLSRWTVGAGVGVAPLRMQPVVEMDVAYRIIGPLSVTTWATIPTTDPTGTNVGVGLRLSF